MSRHGGTTTTHSQGRTPPFGARSVTVASVTVESPNKCNVGAPGCDNRHNDGFDNNLARRANINYKWLAVEQTV